MSQKRTLNNIRRELYIPTLFDRTSQETWMKMGKKEIREAAKERAKRILREHKVKPLSNESKQKIAEILSDAHTKLVKD